MTRAAFAAWNDRMAPLFDVARAVHVVHMEKGRIVRETREVLPEALPVHRALRVAGLGVDVLVCGAVSRPMQAMVEAYGIRVIPFIAGDLREVIEAWLTGTLEGGLHAMPGRLPGGGGRRFRRSKAFPREDRTARGRKRGGAGSRGASGTGSPGRAGRRVGPYAAGPGGMCACPQCGHKAPHERGLPCLQMQCPACGAAMTRE